ncbi:PRC-barrel domain containing protein [Gimesia benthica]|uniref:PRC-barrel domain containing protein n=1 Tax=Gimesia benthica TaxID=2608982 RepID=A0A6I6A7U0_9PLAN|nr:PRC-barrel domain-containing protein [Gimesia benthica]QGQ22427.1 PRC-barrel domain containing protein [Gimesia benthica]
MKPVTVITGAIAISIGSVLLTGSGHAQNKPNISKENHSDFQEKISKPPAKDCTFLRAAAVLTKRVTNLKQQNVGEINDFVLDSNNGKIRYAAVTYGGFPGFGNKMFAVPFEALTVLPNNNHEHDHRFLLKVDQEQLDGATGFEQDHWPDFADQELLNKPDRRYNVRQDPDAPPSNAVIRANQLLNLKVLNIEDDQIGKVEEIILDTAHRKARYIIVSLNHHTTNGNKLFAVPFQAFQVKSDLMNDNQQNLVLKMSNHQITKIQGFDRDHWPDFTDPVYRKSLIEQFLFVKKHKDQGVKVGIDS